MKANNMPAPNEMVWYKWFPVKARMSLRFASLTLEQEGAYRRMYDLASLAQPSSRRGYFYEHDRPATLKDVFKLLAIHHSKGHAIVKHLASIGLMKQDENGAWGFTNFAKHQRTAPLRKRSDGLGSAETDDESAQNRREIGAIDADADVEADADTEADTNEQQKQTCSEPGTAPVPELSVPPVLVGLELYETDKKLLKAWPKLEPALLKANPGVDLPDQIAKAHAWETANPQRRKRDRPRFLANWLARAQDKLEQPQRFESFAARDKRERAETGKRLEKALEEERLEMEAKKNEKEGL